MVFKKFGVFGLALALFVFSSSLVSGASIDLLSEDGVEMVDYDDCLGLTIDGLYYTMTLKDNVVQKFELNGSETPDYEISTSTSLLFDFVKNYDDFGSMERIGYLVNKIGFPAKFFLNIGYNGGVLV